MMRQLQNNGSLTTNEEDLYPSTLFPNDTDVVGTIKCNYTADLDSATPGIQNNLYSAKPKEHTTLII
jgi:hypothetical protein